MKTCYMRQLESQYELFRFYITFKIHPKLLESQSQISIIMSQLSYVMQTSTTLVNAPKNNQIN